MNAEELRKIALSSRDANLNAVARALAAHLEDEHGGGEGEISEAEWKTAVGEAEADRDRLQSELDEAWEFTHKVAAERNRFTKERDAALAAKEKAEADHAIDSESGRRWMKDCRAAQARLKEAERHIDLVTTHLSGKSLEGAEYTDLAAALDFLAPSSGAADEEPGEPALQPFSLPDNPDGYLPSDPSPRPAEREAQEGDVLEMANGSKIHCGPVPDDEKLRSTQYDALVLDPALYPPRPPRFPLGAPPMDFRLRGLLYPIGTPVYLDTETGMLYVEHEADAPPIFTPAHLEKVEALLRKEWPAYLDSIRRVIAALASEGEASTPPEPQEDRE